MCESVRVLLDLSSNHIVRNTGCHMAAVAETYSLGLSIRENTVKASLLFRYKYHDVFLSKIAVDHDNEHSYHLWYGRLPYF